MTTKKDLIEKYSNERFQRTYDKLLIIDEFLQDLSSLPDEGVDIDDVMIDLAPYIYECRVSEIRKVLEIYLSPKESPLAHLSIKTNSDEFVVRNTGDKDITIEVCKEYPKESKEDKLIYGCFNGTFETGGIFNGNNSVDKEESKECKKKIEKLEYVLDGVRPQNTPLTDGNMSRIECKINEIILRINNHK